MDRSSTPCKGYRNTGNSCLWNLQSYSKKFLFVKSGTLGFGIWSTAQGNQTPINDWNPKSKFQLIRNLEPGIHNPRCGIQSPCLSWIPLHVLHGGRNLAKSKRHLIVNSCDFVLRDKTGKFPDYPDDDEGGSAAIFKEKDPAEVTFKSFSQWLIQGRGPPLFLDQTAPPAPPLSEGLDLPLSLYVYLWLRAVFIWVSKGNWFCVYYATWLA